MSSGRVFERKQSAPSCDLYAACARGTAPWRRGDPSTISMSRSTPSVRAERWPPGRRQPPRGCTSVPIRAGRPRSRLQARTSVRSCRCDRSTDRRSPPEYTASAVGGPASGASRRSRRSPRVHGRRIRYRRVIVPGCRVRHRRKSRATERRRTRFGYATGQAVTVPAIPERRAAPFAVATPNAIRARVDLRQPNDPIPAGELTQDCRDDLRQQNDQL